MWALRFAGWFALCGVLSCAPSAPSRWAVGGQPLQVSAARWRGGMLKRDVFINQQGQVSVDGELLYAIDAEGRVVDEDGAPFAVLDIDGTLTGADDRFLGQVGRHNASPPWSGVAWVRVARDGNAFLLGPGQVVEAGEWAGCSEASLRLCTLVTHLVALSSIRRPSPPLQPMYPPMYPYPYPFFRSYYWGWY